jgi:hypothetical protein
MSLILVLVEITSWRVVQVLRTIEGLEASTSSVYLCLQHADMGMLYSYVYTYVVVENWRQFLYHTQRRNIVGLTPLDE